METYLYHQMEQVERKHWWFSARQHILLEFLKKNTILQEENVVDIGCGTGHFLSLLQQEGAKVQGVDISEEAVFYAKQKGITVHQTNFPNEIPSCLADSTLILMLDVLEHFEDDVKVLNALHQATSEESKVLATVPLHPFLWSSHDVQHHHYRRYSIKGLYDLFDQTGWQLEYGSSYNSFLFPVALAKRGWERLSGQGGDDNAIPSPFLNSMLYRVFKSEAYFIRNKEAFPFGLSYLAFLKKKGNQL